LAGRQKQPAAAEKLLRFSTRGVLLRRKFSKSFKFHTATSRLSDFFRIYLRRFVADTGAATDRAKITAFLSGSSLFNYRPPWPATPGRARRAPLETAGISSYLTQSSAKRARAVNPARPLHTEQPFYPAPSSK
jgi:hypothetical protein